MSNFSTASSGNGQITSTSNGPHKLVVAGTDGKKSLLTASHDFELGFDALFLTASSRNLTISGAQDVLLSSNAGKISLETSANGDIEFSRGASLLAAFFNDAYTSGGLANSGHSAFVYGGDSEATLDDDVGSYLDNSNAAKRIDFSIGSPTTAKNLYVGGNAEIKGHLESVSTSAWNGLAHFKAGVLIDTAGTLDVDVTSDFSAQVVISDTSPATNATDGALRVDGGISVGDNSFMDGNVVITGDLTVQGASTVIETTVLSIQDPIIELARTANNAPIPSATTYDTGIRSRYHDGVAEKDLFFGYDLSEDKFTFFAEIDDAEAVGPVVQNGVLGNVKFGQIHTNQLSSGSIPFYSADGLDEFQVTSGAGTASLIQADVGGGLNGSFVKVNSEMNATSKSDGAFQVKGGVGIEKDLYADNIFSANNISANLASDRLVFTGANGLLSVSDLLRVSNMSGAGQLEIYDNAGTPVRYAMFDGTAKKFIADDIQLTTATAIGGVIFSDNAGNLSDDARFSFNDAANAAEFLVQSTGSTQILRVEESNLMVTAANATVQSLTTQGGITFSDNTGLLADSADLVWDGSYVDITGGIKADTDILFDGAGTQSIKMQRASADNLEIVRESDTGADIRMYAQNFSDSAASVGADILLHARKTPGMSNPVTDNVGSVTLRSDKTGANATGINLLTSGSAIELTSSTGVILDVLIGKEETANQYHTSNLAESLSVGALGSETKIVTLVDEYRHSVGDTDFVNSAKPVAEFEWGVAMLATSGALPVFDTSASKSSGILHTTMSSTGQAVEMPELRYNGELIVGWNGTQYALAGSSMQAVYDESAANSASPMILLDGTNDLSIEVVNGSEFRLENGPDAILRGLHNGSAPGLILGSAGAEVSFDGLINTSILLAESSPGVIGYDSAPSAGTKSITIQGHNSSGAQSGDISIEPGSGPGALEKGNTVISQEDGKQIAIATGIGAPAAVEMGYVVDVTLNKVNVGSAGSYRGAFGVAVADYAPGNKMSLAMNGTIVLVAESGTTISGSATPAGTRVFLSDQNDGTVQPTSPNGVGDRVVQFGYLISNVAIPHPSGHNLVKVLMQVLDEGEIF